MTSRRERLLRGIHPPRTDLGSPTHAAFVYGSRGHERSWQSAVDPIGSRVAEMTDAERGERTKALLAADKRQVSHEDHPLPSEAECHDSGDARGPSGWHRYHEGRKRHHVTQEARP
jgi:hypothetical protein